MTIFGCKPLSVNTAARVVRAALALSLLTSCGPGEPPPKQIRHPTVQGAATDSIVQPGHYIGYDILRDRQSATLAVVGVGSKPVPWILRTDDAKLREDFRSWTSGRLGFAQVHTAHTTGFGGSCHGGTPAMTVTLSDWRELDAAARAIGTGFATDDLRGEVDLLIAAPPVAL